MSIGHDSMLDYSSFDLFVKLAKCIEIEENEEKFFFFIFISE